MGVISKDGNQIKLYFNSNNSVHKQTYAYAVSTTKQFLGMDTAKQKVTGTQWAELADGLGVDIADLIDTSHTDFIKEYGKDVNMEDHDWLKVLEKHPETLTHPIAIIGEAYYRIKSPSDFIQYLEPDSVGKPKPYKE
ncbi:MAG: hypothetical protein WBG90_12450 [Saonia sp.]